MMGDWIRGTRGMKAEVKGVYIGLLIHQYDAGFLPDDLETLALIEPEVGKVWVFLKDKFPPSGPGQLKNLKLEEVREFWNKQVQNGKKGGRPKNKNPNNNPKANPNHNHHNDLDLDNDNDNYILIGEEKIFDVIKILEFREAALNGRVKEHGLAPWRTLVPPWFEQNLQGFFQDETHVFNAFSKYIISKNDKRTKTQGANGQKIAGEGGRKPFGTL